MFKEQGGPDIQDDLVYSIKIGFHQIKILAFLRNNLSPFSGAFIKTPRANISEDIDIDYENYISQELSFFLNNNVSQSGYLFGFQAAGPDILVRQMGSRVHGPTLLFIEAKRLYPRSDKDYVKTGISRFKSEEHGKGHAMAAMLGYVQSEDFEYWFEKVNLWIEDFIAKNDTEVRWGQGDKICKVRVANVGEYKSTHSRISEKSITIHHFWIDLCGIG